jgi:hypothetical protein
VWGSWYIDPYFLDLGTSWRWVVSFTLRPLYPWGKSPRYPFDSRLGGSQGWSGRRGEEKILDPTVSRPLSRPARSQSLYRLRCFGFLLASGNKYPTVNSWFWYFNVFITSFALLHFRAINGKEFVTLNDLSATCLLILNTFAQVMPNQHGEMTHVLGNVSS